MNGSGGEAEGVAASSPLAAVRRRRGSCADAPCGDRSGPVTGSGPLGSAEINRGRGCASLFPRAVEMLVRDYEKATYRSDTYRSLHDSKRVQLVGDSLA